MKELDQVFKLQVWIPQPAPILPPGPRLPQVWKGAWEEASTGEADRSSDAAVICFMFALKKITGLDF